MLRDSRHSLTLLVTKRQKQSEEIMIPNKLQKKTRLTETLNSSKTHLHIVCHLSVPFRCDLLTQNTLHLTCVCVCKADR